MSVKSTIVLLHERVGVWLVVEHLHLLENPFLQQPTSNIMRYRKSKEFRLYGEAKKLSSS